MMAPLNGEGVFWRGDSVMAAERVTTQRISAPLVNLKPPQSVREAEGHGS